MLLLIRFIVGALLLLGASAGPARRRPADDLARCWRQQGGELGNRALRFAFTEQSQELEHSQYPWQATAYAKQGTLTVNARAFLKLDSLRQGSRLYTSQTQLGPEELLRLDYGDKDLLPATPALYAEHLLGTARYSPLPLLRYFVEQRVAPSPSAAAGLARYETRLHGAVVRLFIDKKPGLLDRIEILSHDELFGDVLTTITYRDYAALQNLRFARKVSISKLGGKLQDEVQLRGATLVAQVTPLLTRPAGYALREPALPPPPVARRFRPNLHLLALAHTDDRVLVAEFRDFLVVAEAPLNSRNGEAILTAARALAPGKPVRYFVAGHYHPHYLGGLRPFVRHGATILCGPGTADYVRYLAYAPHTLQPDSLQLRPRIAQVEEVSGSKTITDGQFTMQIHHIGAASAHTNDYLVYYFPTEKLLFEDDLVWIKREGAPRKPSARQTGLYQAIKARGLAVDTVLQSWPVTDAGVKTIIPFADLEQAMQVK
ncbi:hypothetical protein EJV47_06750 [Hymenobacter gummosus]|uniref:MBL fold metallo-hydrolase n=1 Tax=Hymenobacter gummosus TaxID=1776032 RepID=A0A431U5B4_9BACT|nr:hypothetical protein [Hymenobacter gummosus]RTQ51494.1 hypothetical protein EJV47_06750 [Hymenobacter gummosus]